jgi:GNAT superfamily N-acetyltransferase
MDTACTRRIVRKADPEVPEEWFLMYEGDLLVGYADAITRGDEVWLAEIGVHPQHRRRGLGTALLKEVIAAYPGDQVALSAEAFTPDLEGWPWRKGMQGAALAAWYARHGFRAAPDEDTPHRMVRVP